MTLEVVCAIAIASMIWNIYNLIKICLLENKICYQKGQIEALIRREPTQTNAKNNALDDTKKNRIPYSPDSNVQWT